MKMCLFCHFDIFVFEFHAILTIWNNKYIKISCLLSADGAGALFYFIFFFFLFLATSVDGASTFFFFFFFFSIFFSKERANPTTNESIWCGLKCHFNFII